jgi:predicted porin
VKISKVITTALVLHSLGVLGATKLARAADLGGNCCADLEERIAELEATTARKGNRKVSLTVSGQVSRAVMGWDDGVESNAYIVGNKNDQTYLAFIGEAAIAPGWKAGYDITIRFRDALSLEVTQASGNGATTPFQLWQSHWYLESETHGKFTAGLASRVSDTAPEWDYSETIAAAFAGVQEVGGSFLLRRSDQALSRTTWLDIYDHFNGETANVVRYDTPSLMGFTVSASWGEDDIWDVGLAYEGEGGGFKLGGALAYTEVTDAVSAIGTVPDASTVVGSLALLHVPTGLNLAVAAGHREWDGTAADEDGVNRTPVDTDFIYAKLGWLAKLNHLGPTAFYGEYGWFKDFASAGMDAAGVASLSAANVANAGCANAALACRVTGNTAEVWGVGFVQHIESAEMQLYVGYRHHTADFDLVDVNGNGVASSSIEAFDTIMAGSLIAF